MNPRQQQKWRLCMPVHPISFSICASKVVEDVPPKTRLLSRIVPGEPYAYTTEADYYAEYRRSWFAVTVSKLGWDCMRHYEILAQGCIPLFLDLEECPAGTLTHFPKDLVREGLGLYDAALDRGTPDVPALTSLIRRLLDHTRAYLTNARMAAWMLGQVVSRPVQQVLFLSACPHPDYLRCQILTGLKQALGPACHDTCRIDHLYEDYPEELVHACYGKGFSYTRNLPGGARDPGRDATVLDDLRHHVYDLVIYGSYHRHGGQLPYWNEVHATYVPGEIVLLCGEDRLTDICTRDHQEWADRGYHVFVREMM